MEDSRLSYLEKFNQDVETTLDFAEHDINILKHAGEDVLEDIDGIVVEKSKAIVHDFFGYRDIRVTSFDEEDLFSRALGFVVGQPAITLDPTLNPIRKPLQIAGSSARAAIESNPIGREVVETTREITEGTVDAGTAVAVYTTKGSTSIATQTINAVANTVTGAIEMVKNIPSNASSYAKNKTIGLIKEAYNSLPSNLATTFMEKFWSFVHSMSDFFYITCALVIIGKFDFLLENTYAIIVMAILIVYTINTR